MVGADRSAKTFGFKFCDFLRTTMEAQAADLRSELAALKKEVGLLRDERDVARLLNEYVYIHDQAFSPAALVDEELDRQFEGFFTEDGVVDAFGMHTTREGKAEWVRGVLTSQESIVGIQMVTSNTLIQVSDDGLTATARTSAITTIAAEGQEMVNYHRAAGCYTYRLRKEGGAWKIANLKWPRSDSNSQIAPTMVNLKPRFCRLLSAITLAIVIVDALPYRERRPLELGVTDIPESNIDVWAPLVRRDGAGSGSAKARLMRQREAAASFEANRLAQSKARMEDTLWSALDPRVSALGNPGARPTEAQTEPRHHRHHSNYYRRTSIAANDPLTTSGDNNPIYAPSPKRHAHPVKYLVAVEQVDPMSGGAGAQVDKRHGRPHHPHHRPIDTSKGGHSQHWYEHHHLDPHNPHREHHHTRTSGPRPRRLRGYDDDEVKDTFIAPASVRVKSKNSAKPKTSGPGVASGKMMKKPKEKAPTGLYRAVRPAGIDTNGSVGTGGQASQGQLDRRGTLVRRNFTANATTSELTATRLATTTTSTTRITGIVDLIANANGAKLGSLSASPIPPSTFGASLENTSFYNATPFFYLIDATLNPTEQTTFYMRRVENQSPLSAGPSTNPATQAVQDLLVFLQAQVPNSKHDSLCATFNSLAKDIQTFGLALCMDSSGIGGSTGTSQTFRYSPRTGVVRPFYGVVGQSGVLMDDEVNRMNGPGFSYPNHTLDSNETTVVGPGSTPVSLAPPDPFLQPVSLFSLITAANSTSSAQDPSIPAAPPTSDPIRPFVIGDLEFVLQTLVGPSGLGEEADEGVLMVFRRTHVAPGEDMDHSQGMRAEVKRGLNGADGLAQFRSGLAGGGSRGTEPAEDHNSDKPSTFEEHKDRVPTSNPEPRTTGLPTGRPSGEATSVRGDITHPRIEHAPTTPSATATLLPQSSSSPAAHMSFENATNLPTVDQNLDEFEDESNSEPDDMPKPVVNVAYFGDSGRSPPVPPEDQADNSRAILVADPSKSKKTGATPVMLATAHDERLKDGDTIGVYLVGPKAGMKHTARIVSVAKHGSTHDQGGSAESLPVDASD